MDFHSPVSLELFPDDRVPFLLQHGGSPFPAVRFSDLFASAAVLFLYSIDLLSQHDSVSTILYANYLKVNQTRLNALKIHQSQSCRTPAQHHNLLARTQIA
jgi:hypothetical protein